MMVLNERLLVLGTQKVGGMEGNQKVVGMEGS